MIRACIFDLDGVIVDTARYHYLAWKRLARGLGHDLTESENERLKGISRMTSLDIVLELAGVNPGEAHKETLAEKKNRWFNEYVQEMTPGDIFPGVKQLIAALRNAGLKVGLASSSKNAGTVLRKLNIEHDFDAVVDGGMIRHAKPDPEIFLVAAEKLGVKPSECVVIEDATSGIEAAHAAGMKCVGIGPAELLGKADLTFRKTSDIDVSTILRPGDTTHGDIR